MKLLVGLGNPGSKYAGNRHNVGFMAVERIAAHCGLGPWRKNFQGQIAAGRIDSERVLLLKPQTYYNEAGRSVGEAMRFHDIDVADLVVFHDEIDLAPGKIRVKTGGGHAGNNGLRSIVSHLSADFVRVRIGVGHPGDKNKVANYVLRDFPRADALWLETMLDAIAASAGRIVAGDLERFQTDVSQKLSDIVKDNKPANPAAGQTGAANVPQGPRKTAKPASGGKSHAGRPKPKPAKSGSPSQQQLARQSARPAGRKAKPAATETDTAATSDAEPPKVAPTTALADRLKQWLARGGKKG